MNIELTTSLASQINRAHIACCEADGPVREALIAKANAARECGLYLIEAKEQVGHGKWMEWANSNLGFSLEIAHRYMRFARAYPQPIESLPEGVGSVKAALIASGALEAPSRDGQQTRHELGFNATLTSLMMGFRRNVLARPLEQWAEEEKQTAIQELKPFAEWYEQLCESWATASHA